MRDEHDEDYGSDYDPYDTVPSEEYPSETYPDSDPEQYRPVFRIGDVVTFKGGDNLVEMNVVNVNRIKPVVMVAWFNTQAEMLRTVLPAACLCLIQPHRLFEDLAGD